MSNDKYGFVYLWYDRKHHRFYIGSHWGREDDGYICSSKWMLNAYKIRPQDFKYRRILSRIYTNKKDLLDEEYKFLSRIKKEELKVRYYNLHNHHFNHWSANPTEKLSIAEKLSLAHKGKHFSPNTEFKKGMVLSEETKQKMTISRTGLKRDKPSPLKGQIQSPESIEKRRLSNTGKKRTPEQRERIGKANQGRKLSEEHKQKISQANLGRIFSQESREKSSLSQKGRKLTEEHKQKLREAKKGYVPWNKGLTHTSLPTL